MGDKNPKSAKKNANQKQKQSDENSRKKKAAIEAKLAPKIPVKK